MRWMAAVVWAGVMMTPVWAQEDPVERQVQRLREGLQLSDEQVTKVREILKKQNDDLRGVLTDEQKERYGELLGRMGGGRGGRGGERGWGGGFRGMAIPTTEELKEQLKLSDEQVSKFNEIRDDIRQELREFFMERPSPEEMQKKLQEVRDSAVKRAREILTDEQKLKFDEIVKSFQQQQGSGDAPRPLGSPGERRERPSVDDRVRRAMETLHVDSAEDAAAIRDGVKKVIEAQYAVEDGDRETRRMLDELARKSEASEEEIKAKIEEIRTTRKDKEKTVRDAQKALFEIVTYKQELELIRQGILR